MYDDKQYEKTFVICIVPLPAFLQIHSLIAVFVVSFLGLCVVLMLFLVFLPRKFTLVSTWFDNVKTNSLMVLIRQFADKPTHGQSICGLVN